MVDTIIIQQKITNTESEDCKSSVYIVDRLKRLLFIQLGILH